MTSTKKGGTPAKSKESEDASKAETKPEVTESEEVQPEPTQKPTKPKRSKKAAKAKTPELQAEPKEQPTEPKQKEGTSFADMAAGYLGQLEQAGCSESTINGYRRELVLAASIIGEDRPLAELTPEHVEAFLASDVVTKKRDGGPKSRLSTDRTERVLRQALQWAEQHGLVEHAPIPVEKG